MAIFNVGAGGNTNITTNTKTNLTGVLKGDGANVKQAVAGTDYQAPITAGIDYQVPLTAGTDYATPANVNSTVSTHNSNSSAHSTLFNAKQNIPALASSLPASGTALTANTIYAVTDAVGTYAFTPPDTGWAHGKFTTDSSVSVSFSGTFMGAAPTIEASKAYEFDVYNGVWAVQEVVSA